MPVEAGLMMVLVQNVQGALDMEKRRTNRLVVAALVAAAGWPMSALAQETPSAPAVPVGQENPAQPAASAPAPKPGDALIRFNFKDAPFDQVLDFFQRECGLPKIDETEVPKGTMTFISGESYSFEDALTILNLNLLAKGVQLRREGNYLYLGTLKDAARKAADVARGTVPDRARPEQIINLTIPLSNARAELVVEQLKGLVAEYGSIIAVPAQNLLIVVETAAQCRRIQEIIQEIDTQKQIDSSTKIFKLQHAKAETVHAALKGLIAEKRTTVMFDDKGKRREISEDTIAGLNLQPDPRTNSIIAVGSMTRIAVVEELIALLDVPEAGLGDQKMMTFTLETASANQAAAEIGKLFATVEATRKPTIIPLQESGKLTMVGPSSLLAQAVMLLGELDPGAQQTGGAPGLVRTPRPERRASVIRLTYITPANIDQLAPRLLTQRQLTVVKFGASPDGRGIVVTGPDADVTVFEELVKGLDVAPEFSKEIRQVRIAAGDAKAVLERARSLHEMTGRDKTDPVTASLDDESRTVTLIGGRAAIERFAELLKSTEGTVVSDMESRTYELAKVRPSVLGPKLARVVRPLLTPDDGAAYQEPRFEPLDELRTLIVRAAPHQFGVIESMVKRLDQDDPGLQQFRIMRLSRNAGDPKSLVERAQKLYAEQTKGLAADQAGPVSVDIDEAAGTLLISAGAGGMQRFADLLTQLQQLTPPARTTRLVDVQKARAEDLVGPLKEFLASADSIDPARKVPQPTISVVERTNTLMVTAEDAQHRLIQDYVQRLDRTDAALPPLKLLQLRAAESTAIAAMLNEQYSKRPQAERALRPVEVRADAATNTLVVSAHPDLFEEIRAFVSDLNSKEKLEGTAKITQLFPLKVAKAVDVAAAMDKLYPVPPVPVDRLNRPMPWLQQPKPVTVSADASSNTLMIYAPADQMESIQALAEKLDRVELPPQAEMKTYRVVGTNLDTIARTLSGMAARGMLVGPSQPGKPAVQVMVEAEPKSSTLIVAGDEVTFERVEAMLKDLSAVPVEKGLRIFPVANLRAADVKSRAQAIYDAQVSQIPGANPIEITVDDKNNQLMVVADGESMQRFAKVMDELAKQAGPPRDVRMIELRFAKAEKVKSFLDELIRSSESLRIRGGADPVVEVIETSNALMIAAQPSQFPIIEALARNLDNKESTERPPMRILKLRATDAANLASVLQQSYDRRPTEQRAKQPVDIQADAATNTLIVSADPSLVPEIEQIVGELNQQDLDQDGREIRIFPLKVARAEELAKTIDAMYPEPPVPIDPRTRQPRPDLKLPKEVTVRADRGTNSLIVDAPGKRLAGFEQIVKSLDQAKLAGNVELRAYRVERADLQAAAAALRNAAANGALYAQGRAATLSPVTVDAEPTSRTLIVSGPSEVFKGVEEVLKNIDAMPDRPTTGVKMYALKNGRAERLQPILQKVILSRVREQLQASGQSVTDAATLVDVAADAGSNTIVVSAPENVLVIADALMSTLDQQSGGGSGEMRVFRLTRGDAASAAKAITASLAADPTGDPAPSVTAEPASNSIVIVGTSRQLEKAGKLVEELDATVEKGGVGIRTVKLRFARAEAVQPVLETLLKKDSIVSMLPAWEVSRYLAQSGGKGENEVRVAAERSTNSVIISAPVAVLDMAEQVIAELDVDPDTAGQRSERPVRIITLGNADAAELAASIEAVLAEEPAAGVEPPTVRVDKASNSLIVRASPGQMAQVEDLAKKLDAATVNSSRQMRMIPVDRSRADATLMAQTLRRLLEQQGGVRVEVITADQLLKDGAEPKAEAKPAGHSDAAPAASPALPADPEGGWGSWLATFRVAAAIGALQPEQPAAAGPDPDEPAGVTIAVDPATNSLVVVGSPRMTDRLASLAAELEKQMPAEPSRVRIVSLPAGADGEALAEIVRQTVRQLGRSGPGNPGGFTGQVSISPDPAGGALIVWANDTDFRSVGELVRAVAQLDPATSLTIKVYPLSTVTASKAIQAVGDLLSPQPRGRQAQRFRGAMDITVLDADGKETQAKIDPALVRLTADPAGASIIVAAPAATLPLIDRFISLIDQSPVSDRLAIRRYDVKNARAQDLAQTFGQLFEAQRQGPAREEIPQARFIADARTNSILVTASEPQHTEVLRLLGTMDTELLDDGLKLEVLSLQNAQPSTVQKIVEQVVVGRNPGLKERVQVSAQDSSSIIVVKAPAEQLEEIKGIIEQVDKADMAALPVRFVKLQTADAQSVAAALQRFFQDRAQAASRGGQRQTSRVSVMGDRRSGTLIVSASDEDFAQLQSLVGTFDAPSKAQKMEFKIVPLQNARVGDIQDTVQNIASELQWERQSGNMFFWDPWAGGRRNSDAPPEDKLYVETNERTNSVVLMGQGETLQTMMKIIEELDKPQSEQTRLVVRSVRIERGDLRAMADIVRQATTNPSWRSWRGTDPDGVNVQVDQARRLLLLIGKQPRVEQALAYVNELKDAGGSADVVFESITLKHAQASRTAETLKRVFADRAQTAGVVADQVSIVGSQDGNLLMISADAENLKMIRDLLGQIDQPELGKDRQIEVYTVRNREADEIAGLIRAQFPSSRGRSESQVIVTPQPSTNMVIVSAQSDDHPTVLALIRQLDVPPSEETSRLAAVTLKSARAEEVANALRTALPPGMKVKITPVRRNNTILITGSDETVRVVTDQIAQIDVELDRPLVEFKRVRLKNAIADDVYFTLVQMLRARPRPGPGEPEPTVDYTRADNTITFSGTADQVRDIDAMITTLDVPSVENRKREFVRLEFAKAEATAKALEVFYGRFAPEANTPEARAVTIVPDPASNSLVVSADESEWEGLRALLKTLDREEYDTSRQIEVVPLKHADATSVARALNEGFRAPVESRLRREQARQQNTGGRNNQRPQDVQEPLVLVDTEGTPTVSAETQTNSLIVHAGRQDLARIRALVAQIDVPDFVKFPDARILPLKSGKASQVAKTINDLFVGPGRQRNAQGPRATVIVGDDVSNALIVRAEESEFVQIAALAEALQQQGDIAQATVRVLPLKNVPASRLQRTLSTTFAQTARQQSEVLSIEVDRTSNSLVVASSRRMYDEIEKVARELDGVLPAQPEDGVKVAPGPLGQTIFIIDVQNNGPEDVRKQLEQLGVTKPQSDDRPGVVSEAVTIVPLTSRRALAVVASPQDGEAIVSLVRALDAAPAEPDQKMTVVALKLATAAPLVATLKSMLNPGEQASQTGPARAVAEQVRRLNVARNGIGEGDLVLDLSRPIRLIADEQTNSIVIGSTAANVATVQELIKTLDSLPTGDAVVIRIFPLTNASATRAKGVIDDLFSQGEALRRLPGTRRQGLPTTATGKALAGEIAVSVDERTNTIVVAGREEAVALVEVLMKDLDSDQAAKWVEPTLIQLKFADAVQLAQTLRQVLVQGLSVTPEALGLQKQVGRLRMAKAGRDMGDPANRVEADLFAPLSGLVITPEPQLNALIVVGSSANIGVVRELASLLDVEAASAANMVRIFPLDHAAADRVNALVTDFFRQRQSDASAREEDRLIATADLRTNSLIVSTSPRSLAILESMIRTLDTAESRNTVSLHVVPVTGANAQQLAPKIDKLMRERIAASRGSGGVQNPQDTFSIEADPVGGVLIVACSDENLALVKELVATLSQGTAALAGLSRTDVIQIKSGRAADVAGAIRQLYTDRENDLRGEGSVNVVPNERLNALVVTGTDADMARIRELIAQQENAPVATAQDIRRIGLRSANALEVVSLLQGVLAGRSVGGGADVSARQATNLRFFREQVAEVAAAATGAKPTEALIDGVIREQISLSPDLRTNSVVVKAPTQVMGVIAAIIDDLDTTSAGARGVETITLINADARQTATLLRDIFTLRQAGDTYILVPSMYQPQPGEPEENVQPNTLTPVPDQRQQLSIAVDARTNSLIVSGTEEYLERVVTIVKDLDAKQGTERESRVYAIRNTKAKDLETTLQSYFRGEADKRNVLDPNQTGSAQRQLEQEVTVVGDEKSNKLIISTSPRYMDMVLSMVEELDAAPPQVHIQVLLAEITTDTNGQWGFDFRARDVGGKNFNIMSAAAGVGVAAALGLPNLTFASADFDFIIRALEAQGKLQVLSSPYLQARNNEPAYIQVGDNIAIVEGNTQITPQGGTIAAVTRKDIGIILNVTPSISPDGFVRMEVAPEISSLSARTTQVTAELQAPIIAQRKVKTTVTVKDGQTVVIGGLLQTQTENRRTKVPLLGDIPFAGWLFRTKQDSDVKTELLVILTPKVIYSDTPEGEDLQQHIVDQKIEASESPQMIREAMDKNGSFERTAEIIEPEHLPPAPPPPAPPEPAPRPAYPDQGIYRPSKKH